MIELDCINFLINAPKHFLVSSFCKMTTLFCIIIKKSNIDYHREGCDDGVIKPKLEGGSVTLEVGRKCWEHLVCEQLEDKQMFIETKGFSRC